MNKKIAIIIGLCALTTHTITMSMDERRKAQKLHMKAKALLNVSDSQANTGLHQALINNWPAEVFQKLLHAISKKDSIESLNLRNEQGVTPLMRAAYMNRADIIELLLEKAKIFEAGVETLLTTTAPGNQAAFIIASIEKNVEAMKKLANYMSLEQIVRNDKTYISPLLFVISKGNLPAVRILLERARSFKDGIPSLLQSPISATGATPLYAACHCNQIAIAHELARHASLEILNSPTCDGHTPLMVATDGGYKGIVKILLDRAHALEKEQQTAASAATTSSTIPNPIKSLLDATTQWGETPLYYACFCDNETTPIAEEKKMDALTPLLPYLSIEQINHAIPVGKNTPLMRALYSNYTELAKALLNAAHTLDEKNGINLLLQSCNDAEGTPFYIACELSNKEMVDLILPHITLKQLNQTRKGGWTPFMVAIEKGASTIIDSLMERAHELDPVNGIHTLLASTLATGDTALYLACNYQWPSIVQKLLPHITTIEQLNAQGEGKWTPFIVACYRENMPIIKALLQRAAEIDPEHGITALISHELTPGETALYRACLSNRQEIVKTILAYSSFKDLTGNFNTFSPLMAAADSGHGESIIPLLIEKASQYPEGIKMVIAATSSHGDTPLHYACQQTDDKAVQQLLPWMTFEHINAEAIDGRTPLICASYSENITGIAALLEHARCPAEMSTLIHHADKKGWTSAIHAVASDKLYSLLTLIHYASTLPDGIERLTTAITREGNTALHLACAYKKIDAVQLLLHYMPSDAINMHNNRGETPLTFAAEKGYCEIAHLLLEKAREKEGCCQALLAATNNDGQTALDIATAMGFADLIQLLTPAKDGASASPTDDLETDNSSIDGSSRMTTPATIDDHLQPELPKGTFVPVAADSIDGENDTSEPLMPLVETAQPSTDSGGAPHHTTPTDELHHLLQTIGTKQAVDNSYVDPQSIPTATMPRDISKGIKIKDPKHNATIILFPWALHKKASRATPTASSYINAWITKPKEICDAHIDGSAAIKKDQTFRHTFATRINDFVTSLGIIDQEKADLNKTKHKDSSIQFFIIPGVKIDDVTGKKTYGTFEYLCNKDTLFHRYFSPLPLLPLTEKFGVSEDERATVVTSAEESSQHTERADTHLDGFTTVYRNPRLMATYKSLDFSSPSSSR